MQMELRRMCGEKIEQSEDNFEIKPDLLPEYCHYKDAGCELADSCLNCPYPQCICEEPGGRQHWLKKLRDREIVRLYGVEGKGVGELALMFGLSRRTIQRAVKSAGNGAGRKKLSKGDLVKNE